MQSILVLTDFSDAAFSAAKYAGVLSNVFQSKRLILFHSSPNNSAVSNEPVVAAGRDNLLKENLQTMELWQESVKPYVSSATEVTGIVEEADLVESVNAFCSEERIDLVVMGITGKTNLEKILIGSNAIRVMTSIHYPLLIVPKDVPDTRPDKVLLATDLKAVKEKTGVPALTKLLDSLKAKLLVLNVADKEMDIPTLKTEIAALHASLNKYWPEFYYENKSDTVEAINAFALEQQVDIIITLHQQQSGLAALFRKSISKKLAWHSRIPLLVIPV